MRLKIIKWLLGLDYIKIISVQPGDKLLVRYPFDMDRDALESLADLVRSVFGEKADGLFLPSNIELSVMRKEEK